MGSKIKLNQNRVVGEGEPVYIVAEGGVTNFGSLELAKKQVDAAMAAGADAIKFQAQTTEALVSKKVDPYWYRRMKYKELPHDELKKLWEYCQIRNIDCFITAHTEVDLDFLDKELNVPFFKIGSGESVNYDFLKNVGSRGKPVIISLGLHLNDNEIKKSIEALTSAGAKDIVILHCNTVLPTPPEINHLRRILHLQKMFNYPVGYSDHTVGWHMVIAAVALGACLIEKHLSFDLNDLRSFDCAGSCTPETLKSMVSQIREVERGLSVPSPLREEKIIAGRKWARQSIVANKNIRQGAKITSGMLALKRPGVGLPQEKLNDVIGKSALKNIELDELITEENIQ
ncbi:MAG: N-acetylneuraminate synthase family protein [Patescibacteria group bacterium]|nr:N-acetylneuraminate synthase family protein [Patescibacteria group bacterium]